MIAYLKGKIKAVSDGYIVLAVDDIGYRVEVTGGKYMENQEAELFIYTHVREQEFRLLGFKSQEDLEMYERLTGISGIGPKAGMALVGQLGVERILYAVQNQNPHALKVSGIGLKTAEKIMFELKGDQELKKKQVYGKIPVGKGVVEEAISALEGLGYKRYEIENEISSIKIQEDWGSEDIIKILLKRLAKSARKE